MAEINPAIIGALKVTVDTSDIDGAIAKAERLKSLIQEIKALGVQFKVATELVAEAP